MMRRCLPLLIVTVTVTSAVMPAAAQTPTLYTRHPSARVERDVPLLDNTPPWSLTADQKLAIAPVRWPAVWPAPKVPVGTVLTVPPRPTGLPGPGEYWGPFTDDSGAWGFLVGPHPDTPPATTPLTPPVRTRFGAAPPPAMAPGPVAAPPAPSMPLAGPVSPDGQMVVSYPDGNRATWQLPMVSYKGRLTGIRPDGSIQLTDAWGRQGSFVLAKNTRITLNGLLTSLSRLSLGAAVSARALRLAPTELTILDAVK